MKRIFLIAGIITLSTTLLISQDGGLAQSVKRGKEVYLGNCMSCHLETGEGIPDAFPPLAKSDYLMKDPKRTIGIILNGQKGEITVNGKKYDAEMPAQSILSDAEISDVINYVSNSWGNKTKVVITPAMVKAARK